MGARRAELLAEADRRAVAHRQGYASTTAWLIALSGDPAAVCRSRPSVATSLQEMPQTPAAFRAREIPDTRVRLLAQARALAPEQYARDEARLVAQAATASSSQLPQVLGEWRRQTDPPGAEADTARLFTRRALHLSPSWSGLVHLDGDLDPEGGSVVLAALRALSEAAALDPGDPRTPPPCRADALVEICRRHLHGRPRGSRRPHLTITIPRETLRAGAGVMQTETGPLTVEAIRRLACDATVTTVILDQQGRPRAAALARRVVPPALRRALDPRDQHCTHPSCHTPARWCDAHHIRHWADGSATTLADLRLLCRRHHRMTHDHQQHPLRL